jgi:translation elongation factor P/translation initiation factor 5A
MKANMKKKAIEIKKGDSIVVGGEDMKVEEVESSDISKQGSKKVRIVAKKKNGERIVIIRPADYPLDSK